MTTVVFLSILITKPGPHFFSVTLNQAEIMSPLAG